MRVQFAGHFFRAPHEMASKFVLWKQNCTGRQKNCTTYPNVIAQDTGISLQDFIGRAMRQREVWRGLVNSTISTEVEQ